MTRLLTILLFFSLPLQSCKETSVSLNKVVKEMAEYKMFEYKYVGLNAELSPQWARYETLLAKASESELLHLCDNESPVVRSYAFRGLVEKNSSKIFEVLTNHINDTSEFERTMGCMVDPCYVTDFYLEQVGYFPKDSSSYKITTQQRNFLDSLMLFGSEITLRTPNYNEVRLRSRNFMLEQLTHTEIYYKRIREIVLADVIEALPALAKFKNPNDASIIKNVFENEGLIGERFVFEAISIFPNPELFPIVEENIKNDLKHDNLFNFRLYKALIQFKTQLSRQLLEEAISKFNLKNSKREINNIKFLISIYPDEMFDDLLK